MTLCSSLKLEINISNSATGPIFIDLITKPVKLDSKEYQKASQLAREMLSKVQEVISKNGMAQNNTSNTASASTADELLKYKNLLDMNAITQEEFDEVKKKLLGM